ncbi:MAG: hypothetical protein E6G08_01785 [Actinobacteria bacterium]|nr:MAG: hypothetical protein E6G08_01785 [Actinomycetota bacterium]
MAVRVAVDALGGDRGPEEIVAGAVDARSSEIEPILFGRAGLDTHGLELIETTQEIGMDEKPSEAVRAKPARRSSPPGTPAPCSPRDCSSCAVCQASTGRRSR